MTDDTLWTVASCATALCASGKSNYNHSRRMSVGYSALLTNQPTPLKNCLKNKHITIVVGLTTGAVLLKLADYAF